MDYEKFLDEILKISSKIRYSGVYNEGKFYHKRQKEVKSYLTEEETETNLSQAVYRWSTRKKVGPKIGKPISNISLVGIGAFSLYVLEGPPEKIIPFGLIFFNASIEML